MASNRHLGRIVALQTLYEFDFRVFCADPDVDLEAVTMRNVGRYHDTLDDKQFVISLVNNVHKASEELDKQIAPLAPEWPVDQIARIDKIILRIALWELGNAKDVPPKVVINEAVELAKAFGGDNSSRFINGVLGTAYRLSTGEIALEDIAKIVKKNSAAKKAKAASEDKPVEKKDEDA